MHIHPVYSESRQALNTTHHDTYYTVPVDLMSIIIGLPVNSLSALAIVFIVMSCLLITLSKPSNSIIMSICSDVLMMSSSSSLDSGGVFAAISVFWYSVMTPA